MTNLVLHNTSISGERDAAGLSIAIVVAEFNRVFTERLAFGAVKCLTAHGGSLEKITTIWVPGSYELPLISKQLAESNKYDGIIALGVLIKGDTDHYHYVANEACSGLTKVMLETNIPIGLGVIPAHTVQQVEERSYVSADGAVDGNKGWEAACAVLQAISLTKQLSE